MFDSKKQTWPGWASVRNVYTIKKMKKITRSSTKFDVAREKKIVCIARTITMHQNYRHTFKNSRNSDLPISDC
jgi:hypothetical protein